MTIQDTVNSNVDKLQSMTLSDLYSWAKKNNYDNKLAFSRFKKALNENGINYDAMKREKDLRKENELNSKCNYKTILITDGSAKHDRYAICNENGSPLWHGKFFENDYDYNGEQSTSEFATAKKAIWLASKIKESINEHVIELELRTDAEWLCWANATDGKGGKAKKLKAQANKLNVILNVVHIKGASNPADYYSRTKGFKKWQDNDLMALAKLK